ncbi:ExeA family protein [Desulfurivibrio alkaliphilus]|uniref:AAA ATPase n=1 Tax=Desulfurivibrio alkaliphilus (strain DSM 19089 / UNIQEM U267 / AHT2) TaxID=589865 RepID=D6Z760_DESAT|nr:AAA family ATPase [Desulfurivibrio alkaliphilus]ADH87047.1 AAA ATPase [Desulfurivibrio alkaliphilus AHT 2]
MQYYQLLDLQREPFANSPDPRLLYLSEQHHDCLQQLELAVRLRRGLSVVIGEVGTGKTTICRRLIRNLGGEGDRRTITRLFLDPNFRCSQEFLADIGRSFKLGGDELKELNERELRERLYNFLLQESLEADRNVLLIIDEGQKLPDFCLEVLRELLNYETNDRKLVQVLIFAQEEFKAQIRRHNYFQDRIAFFFHLRPLGFRETKALVNFRLRQSHRRPATADDLFTTPALWLIYRYSGGYPRRIVMLCSQILLAYIARGSLETVGPRRIRASLVRACARRVFS